MPVKDAATTDEAQIVAAVQRELAELTAARLTGKLVLHFDRGEIRRAEVVRVIRFR